ncbi:hypothetical protein V498_07219, partial [Pseudogymnoascus sp. VKM F-4517 (FW-2822)]
MPMNPIAPPQLLADVTLTSTALISVPQQSPQQKLPSNSLPTISPPTHTLQPRPDTLRHLRIPKLPIPQITQSPNRIPDPRQQRLRLELQKRDLSFDVFGSCVDSGQD